MHFQDSSYEVFKFNSFFSKAICPKIFKDNKNKFLFFAGEKNDRFTKIFKINLSNKKEVDPKICFDIQNKFQRVLSPDIIKNNEKFYMFFEGKINNKTGIFLASSKNLENWDISEKPLIFDNDQPIDYGAPKCISHPESDEYFLYYYKKYKSKKNIYLCILDKNFEILEKFEKPVIFSESNLEEQAVYSPDVHIKENKWMMIYAAWGQKPLKGLIMKAESKDGINWTNKKKILEPSIFEDIKHCSEPCLVKENNVLNLYYEGCDIFNKWKIIRRTSSLK